ncbi:MAG: histidine phosphatase family protein [Ruminococcus sp.]|nr:histidine phosphatase family protein [Ruminococcus sp.]
MRVVFIRHGLTAGNLEKRYIGSTDEPICEEGAIQLRSVEFPHCDILVCSPMKRCTQTADIVFPSQKFEIEPGFRECDFGDFEGRNYIELTGDPYYQKWIDSGGSLPFPSGEAPEDFKKRCTASFEKLTEAHMDTHSIAFVVHGGTIMSILEKYAVPGRNYYDWYCENGHGYICDWNGSQLHITEKI